MSTMADFNHLTAQGPMPRWTAALVGPASGDAVEGLYLITNGDQCITAPMTESAAGLIAAGCNANDDLIVALRNVLRVFGPHPADSVKEEVVAGALNALIQVCSRSTNQKEPSHD